MHQLTPVYKQDGDWWIGYMEELPGANAQERTPEELEASLDEAISLILEFNRELGSTA
jgi:predicted RNase H-like HicB family nuclease